MNEIQQEKDLVTMDLILTFLKKRVELKESLNPEVWIEVATKLDLLRIDEEANLVELEMKYNQKIVDIMDSQEKLSEAAATRRAKTTQEYRDYKMQEIKVKVAESLIRTSKKRSDRAAGF